MRFIFISLVLLSYQALSCGQPPRLTMGGLVNSDDVAQLSREIIARQISPAAWKTKQTNRTLMFFARSKTMVDYLRSQNVSAASLDYKGKSALHFMLLNGSLEAAQALLPHLQNLDGVDFSDNIFRQRISLDYFIKTHPQLGAVDAVWQHQQLRLLQKFLKLRCFSIALPDLRRFLDALVEYSTSNHVLPEDLVPLNLGGGPT